MYTAERDSSYVGVLHFDGTVTVNGGAKKGTFGLTEVGEYSNHGVSSQIKIIDNSGTGELAGISGEGAHFTKEGKTYLKLDVKLSK